MNVNVVSATRLPADQVALWSRLQQADAEVDSPFFRPEYTRAVAAICDGVEVALLRQDSETIGFFPFQQVGGNVGVPVGGHLCDFHGAVVRAGASFRPAALMRGCGLTAWHFDNLLASQKPFRPYHWAEWDASYMDLSGGFDAYQRQRREAGCKELKRAAQKSRKLAREIGPLRLEAHTPDRKVLATLIGWKLDQYRRIKAGNFLSPAWKIELLESLLNAHGEAFSGMLSALYAGDRLVAAHFGLRSYGVLHGWFPAYDPELSKYSPGQILWAELARVAPSLGIRRIDLGRGDERFKRQLGSGTIRLAEGSVDLRRVRGSVRRSWFHAQRWIRSSPLRVPAGYVARNARACLGLHKQTRRSW